MRFYRLGEKEDTQYSNKACDDIIFNLVDNYKVSLPILLTSHVIQNTFTLLYICILTFKSSLSGRQNCVIRYEKFHPPFINVFGQLSQTETHQTTWS